jgi:hypothetical protein
MSRDKQTDRKGQSASKVPDTISWILTSQRAEDPRASRMGWRSFSSGPTQQGDGQQLCTIWALPPYHAHVCAATKCISSTGRRYAMVFSKENAVASRMSHLAPDGFGCITSIQARGSQMGSLCLAKQLS